MTDHDDGVDLAAGPDGRVSTSAVAKAVVGAALGAVDPDAAARSASVREWRKDYLTPYRDLVVAGTRTADAADDVAEAEAHEAASTEAQAGAEATDADDETEAEPAESVAAGPAPVAFGGTTYEAPAVDAYSLRLVTYRKLFDLGTLVQSAPSLASPMPMRL